jgi:hypothetical protein
MADQFKEILDDYQRRVDTVYSTYYGPEENDQQAQPRRTYEHSAAYFEAQTALYVEYLMQEWQRKEHGNPDALAEASNDRSPFLAPITNRDAYLNELRATVSENINEDPAYEQLPYEQKVMKQQELFRDAARANLMEYAPHLNISAIDADIVQRLSYSQVAFENLPAFIKQEINVAVINTQFSDQVVEVYKQLDLQPSKPPYSAHMADFSTPIKNADGLQVGHSDQSVHVYMVLDAKMSSAIFADLQKQHSVALSSAEDPFKDTLTNTTDSFSQPFAVSWKDAKMTDHTAVFVSKDWAKINGLEAAQSLPETERKRYRRHEQTGARVDLHDIITSQAQLGVAYAALYDGLHNEIRSNKMFAEEVKRTDFPERYAQIILESKEVKGDPKRAEPLIDKLVEDIKRADPKADVDAISKKIRGYIDDPASLKRAQEEFIKQEEKQAPAPIDPFAPPAQPHAFVPSAAANMVDLGVMPTPSLPKTGQPVMRGLASSQGLV